MSQKKKPVPRKRKSPTQVPKQQHSKKEINYKPFIVDFTERIIGCAKKYGVNFDEVLEEVYYLKYDKKIGMNIAMRAIENFIQDHPEELDRKWVLSIAKRIAGQMYTHYINNRK